MDGSERMAASTLPASARRRSSCSRRAASSRAEIRGARRRPSGPRRAAEVRARSSRWRRRAPGALGLALRKALYPLLLGSCGRNVVFGQNVVLRHPHKIHIGSNVVIDDNCLLDAKGEIQSRHPDRRRRLRRPQHDPVVQERRHRARRRREHRLQLRGVLGQPRDDWRAASLMAAYSYVIGGDHDFSDPSKPVLEQSRTSAGVTIGDGVWIGAGAKILDGVTIGDDAVIGAGAWFARDVPASAIAVGIPARVVSIAVPEPASQSSQSQAQTKGSSNRVMAYRSELEARLAKKTTKAIVDYQMIEDGDRVMVGLSGGKDSWALLQILDVLRQRAPIHFSLVAVNVDSGYKEYKHDLIASTCEARGWEYRIEHTGIGEMIDDILDDGADAVLAVRAAAPRRAVSDRQGSRRDEDRARPSRRRLHRDAAAESVLRRRAEGDAGQARLRRWRARRDPAAGVRRRRRGARVREGMRAADHRLLLPGVRRPGAAAPAHEAAADGARARASGREAVDAEGARQRRAAASARHAAESAGRAPRRARCRAETPGVDTADRTSADSREVRCLHESRRSARVVSGRDGRR